MLLRRSAENPGNILIRSPLRTFAFFNSLTREVQRMSDTPPLRQPVATDEKCISVIGMAGAGKSTVGKALASALSWAFMDSDHIIEAHYGTRLQDVADSMTKEDFLDVEAEIIRRIGARRTVISTGGSVVYRQAAMEHLQGLGHVVYLNVELPVILERISRNPERGLAIAPGQTVEDLYNERRTLYEAAADFTVSCAGLSPDECTQIIVRWLESQS